MESIQELSRSIGAYLRGRVSNPLYGAYFVAWSAINFRILLILFSDGTAQEKIDHIDKRMYVEWWHWGWYAFLYPLIVATVLVILMPFVGRKITNYLRQQDKKTVEDLLVIEGVTPLDPAKAAELRRSVIAERELRLKEREANETLIAELTQQIDTLISQNLKLKDASRDALGASIELAQAGITAPSGGADQDQEPGRPENKMPAPPSGTYALSEGDFIGVDQRSVLRITTRGISESQARALHILRNGQAASIGKLGELLGFAEKFEIELLIDQMLSLNIVEKDFIGDREVFKITKAGRQVLAAVQKLGFVAKQ